MAEASAFFKSASPFPPVDSARPPGQDSQRPLAKRRCARESKAAASCGICLEIVDDQGFLLRRFSSGVLASSCTHAFCFTCIATWSERTNTCPMCKERFTAIRHNSGGSGKSRDVGGGGGGDGGGTLRMRGAGEIVEVEHRDAAANCSSDDEDLAAALAGDESSGGSSDGGGAEGEGGRVGAYGYVSDGFLVPDDSIESEEDEDGEAEFRWSNSPGLRTTPTTRQRREQAVSGRHWEERVLAAGLLPNELRQLQQEAARLVGDSPLRPRRRPPPPSRLSRYPQRGVTTARNASLSAASTSAAPTPSAARDPTAGFAASRSSAQHAARAGPIRAPESQGRGLQRGTRRSSGSLRVGSTNESRSPGGRQSTGPLRRSSTASGAISFSRPRRAQRRQRQRQDQQEGGGDGSDGWCATSSGEDSQHSDEEYEDRNSSGSDIESWTPRRGDRSSRITGARRGESRRGRVRREGVSTRTRGSVAALRTRTAATALPRPTRSSPWERLSSSPPPSPAGNRAAAAPSGNTRGYGLAAALGLDRAVGDSSSAATATAPAARAAPQPGQWLTRRTGNSSSGGGGGGGRQGRFPWRSSSSTPGAASSVPPQAPQAGSGGDGCGGAAAAREVTSGLASSLACAATRIGAEERLGGLRRGDDGVIGSAADCFRVAGQRGEGEAASSKSFCGGETDEGARKRGRGAAASEDGGGRPRLGMQSNSDEDDNMADDIWMEREASPSPKRTRRTKARRAGGGRGGGDGGGVCGDRGGNGRKSRDDSRRPSYSSSSCASSRCSGGSEDEDEEVEFDWRCQNAPPSRSAKKEQTSKTQKGKSERGEGKQEHEDENEGLEVEWRVGSSASSPAAETNRGAKDLRRCSRGRDNAEGESGEEEEEEEEFALGKYETQRRREGSKSFGRLSWRGQGQESGPHDKENEGPRTRAAKPGGGGGPMPGLLLNWDDDDDDGGGGGDNSASESDDACPFSSQETLQGERKLPRLENDDGGGGGDRKVAADWIRRNGVARRVSPSRQQRGDRFAPSSPASSPQASVEDFLNQFRYTVSSASSTG